MNISAKAIEIFINYLLALHVIYKTENKHKCTNVKYINFRSIKNTTS